MNKEELLVEWRGKELYIEGLHYKFPKRPKRTEIRNHELPKKQQKWFRRDDAEKYDWEEGWEDRLPNNPEQLKFIIDEVDRVANGEWIFINGEATYLNGDTYFFLQHFTLHDSGEYPDYRDTSLIYYRFVEIVDNTKLCTGDTLLKGRRLGATSMVNSRSLRKALLSRNKSFGITSKTGADAEDAFGMIVNAFQNLPVYLKPQIEGTDAPKKVLSMKKQASRVTKGQQTTGTREGLNNKIFWRATSMNTFDSGAFEHVLCDECLSPETKIMMGDGTFLEIDKVQEGDYVMTEGSVPRRVVERTDGYDRMFTIHQPYGLDYEVNSLHRIIVDHRMGGGSKKDGEYIGTPEEILNKFPKSSYRVLNRVTSKGVEFKSKDLPIDPYIFGAWLGDGHSDSPRIVVNPEEEIITELEKYAEKEGYDYNKRKIGNSNKVINFSFKRKGGKGKNKFREFIKDYNLYNNKHIPKEYMTSSIKQRLDVLAGIIDTDGYVPFKDGNIMGTVVIAMSRENLISQIRQMALSCGLSVGNIKHKKSNFNTDVWTINISGEINKIPTKVKRKRLTGHVQQYKSRINKITINPTPRIGRYVGIQVEAYEDNHRKLILEDFTLTMNSGKFPADVPVDKYLQVVTKCVKKGAKVTGKLSLPTTVNPPHLGGSEYRIVWNGSNQREADYLGQTKSGLYRIMIPAYYGFAGYIDEYGNSVIENPTPEQTKYLESTGECPDPNIGAKQYLENVRKQLENDEEALMEEIRMNPFNAEEVFDTANDRCIFPNKDELIRRRKELEDELLDKGLNPDKDELGRRGWFHRINGTIEFVDDSENGLFYVNKLLSRESSNKFTYDRAGKKTPTNEEFGAGGADPVASGDAPIDGGSDACLMIRERYNSLNEDNSGYPVAMFLGRMTDPNKMHEQWFNALEYYGIKMLAERTPQNWLDYAVKEGLENYLYGTTRSDGKEIKGINAQHSEAVKQEHAEAQVLNALSDTKKVPFVHLIRQRLAFNVRKRTDYDTCMADGYACMALKIPFKKPERKKPKKFLKRGKVL